MLALWYLRNFGRSLRDVARGGAGFRLLAVVFSLGVLSLVGWATAVGASSLLYALF